MFKAHVKLFKYLFFLGIKYLAYLLKDKNKENKVFIQTHCVTFIKSFICMKIT